MARLFHPFLGVCHVSLRKSKKTSGFRVDGTIIQVRTLIWMTHLWMTHTRLAMPGLYPVSTGLLASAQFTKITAVVLRRALRGPGRQDCSPEEHIPGVLPGVTKC